VLAAFAIVLGHLGLQTWRSETVYAADVRNPYVYAHTSTALVRFVDQVEDLAQVHPAGRNLSIKIVQPDADYWPLPWYLRRYPGVRYVHSAPDNADADIVILDPAIADEVAASFRDAYFGPVTAGLRPGVLRAVYIKQTLWDTYMTARDAQN
jgi:predicted membrane-bound mannosyltransferase